LIAGDNDGRVAVDDVGDDGMKEFIVLPYRHTRIHKKRDVAEKVDSF